MKIVVAVGEDKQTIIKRTGQSAFFAIYEEGKEVEYVPNKHHDGGHHEHNHFDEEHEAHTHSHRKNVAALEGCDIILVQAVGENMKEALDSVGLTVKKVRQKHGSTANEVVKNFLNNKI